MHFWLEVNGIQIVLDSPLLARKMIDGGAKLIEPSQAEELRRALEMEDVRNSGFRPL
jgi:hypothetical protein